MFTGYNGHIYTKIPVGKKIGMEQNLQIHGLSPKEDEVMEWDFLNAKQI